MLRKRINKTKLRLKEDPTPIEVRKRFVKDILNDSTFFPKTVGYKDIDESFKEWVEEELRVVFEDEVVPTYALFSNQRFTEYMQMWENVDENRNVKMNFKVITRDNNPKERSMYAKAGNIPNNNKFLMKRVEALNDQGKTCYVDYRMAQPLTIDLSYRLTLVTNKYELMNEFNTIVNSKFRSIQSYLFVNGHPMPMKLNNISDDSDYTADDRQYFSQTFEINLSGYILTKDDFEVTVNPVVTLSRIGFEGVKDRKKANVEIEEIDICPIDMESDYYNQPMKLSINFETCDSTTRSFVIDTDMIVTGHSSDNIRVCKLMINGESIKITDIENFKENDEISVSIKPINPNRGCLFVIEGYNPDVFYNKDNYIPESILDETNLVQEIEIQ